MATGKEVAVPRPKTMRVARTVTAEWEFEIGPSYSNPPLPDEVHDYLCRLWGEGKLPGGHGCRVKITLQVKEA